MKHALRLTALVLLSIAPAQAQELAGTFDQLRVLVKPGDTLTITDANGSRTQGRLSELTGSSMVLNVAGALRHFQGTDVDTIAKRGPDSLKNGALTGMAIGAGLTALAIGASGISSQDAGWVALVALLYGGVGAGIGVGVDALIEGNRVIYARSSSTTFNIAPIVRGRSKGLMLRLKRTW